jgi:hypothetical protein
MELVGVYVHSEAKEGRDAGELCGLPPFGITATRNIDTIIAPKPDVDEDWNLRRSGWRCSKTIPPPAGTE